jgi:hypothetical protein
MTKPTFQVIESKTQEALSTQLLNEIRGVIQQDKYNDLYNTTIIGALETLKMMQYMEGFEE